MSPFTKGCSHPSLEFSYGERNSTIVFNWSRTNLIEKVCIRAVTLKACVFYQTVVKWIFVYILYPPPPQVVLPNTILPLFFWNFKSLTHEISK